MSVDRPSGCDVLPGRATAASTRSYVSRTAGGRTQNLKGLCVSSVGIGTGGFVGLRGTSEYARATNALRAALLGGVNVVDTASNYGSRQAEIIVGSCLRDMVRAGEISRDAIVVCTKGGYISPATVITRRQMLAQNLATDFEITAGGHCLAPAYIEDQIAQSLDHLGLSTIDVYYLHNVEEQFLELPRRAAYGRLAEAVTKLEEACRRGSIGGYGFATADGFRRLGRAFHPLFDVAQLVLETVGPDHHCMVLQVPINLAMTEAVFERNQHMGARRHATLLDAAEEVGMAVVASASLGSGRPLPIPPALRSCCPASWSDSQIALQFVRSLPQVSVALVGMTSAQHVQENLMVQHAPLVDLDAAPQS